MIILLTGRINEVQLFCKHTIKLYKKQNRQERTGKTAN